MEERPSRQRGEQPKSYLERWSPLIEGVVVVDVKAANERIEAFLTPLRGATAGAIDSAYDSVGEVLDLLISLKAEGMTMVLATHEMAFAKQVADRFAAPHS